MTEPCAARGPRPGRPADERGFSLMEAIVATVITALAVVGLAHSFGLGHGLIDRYSASRAALGEAQRRMEWLSAYARVRPLNDSLHVGGLYPATASAFSVPGVVSGTVQWRVDAYDDPVTGAITQDMRLVTMYVVYGATSERDTIRITRLLQNP